MNWEACSYQTLGPVMNGSGSVGDTDITRLIKNYDGVH